MKTWKQAKSPWVEQAMVELFGKEYGRSIDTICFGTWS
jgi:hypothetical protein